MYTQDEKEYFIYHKLAGSFARIEGLLNCRDLDLVNKLDFVLMVAYEMESIKVDLVKFNIDQDKHLMLILLCVTLMEKHLEIRLLEIENRKDFSLIFRKIIIKVKSIMQDYVKTNN